MIETRYVIGRYSYLNILSLIELIHNYEIGTIGTDSRSLYTDCRLEIMTFIINGSSQLHSELKKTVQLGPIPHRAAPYE